ncbi:Aste57867_18596 [Aphanomyces stellatus]|uniref:Aste57867_18596 protein n=1 Tax=Aphanomyces stellatus TaxID=120398 RepID=A0A485LC66_9STRA|nr:hypothetical protein As57867_018534 [Aphanomyces stellatus]VFT95331.1 Aste57867_18596 [Aphanomyces stellatus]
MEAMEVQINELTDLLTQKTDQLKNTEYKAVRLQTKLNLALMSVDHLLSSPRKQHAVEINHLQQELDATVRQSPKKANHAARSVTIDGSAIDMAHKYLQERTRNAALHSRLQNAISNMQVHCRVRPVMAHGRSERPPWRR